MLCNFLLGAIKVSIFKQIYSQSRTVLLSMNCVSVLRHSSTVMILVLLVFIFNAHFLQYLS